MSANELAEYQTGETGTEVAPETGTTAVSLAGRRPTAYKRRISIRFHLREAEANAAGECQVRCSARWHGQRLQFNTGELVLPSRGHGRKKEILWEGQRCKPEHPLGFDINARLAGWAKRIATYFYEFYDAAPFQQVSKAALLEKLFPAQEAAKARPAALKTFRELLDEWKQLNPQLDADSRRKYDQLATKMEAWRPALRPSQVTEAIAKEYLLRLLEEQKSDATIKVHFTGLRKCFERLGVPADLPWLKYDAKNAPQLDLEISEVQRLLRYRPDTDALRTERDRWLFQLLSGRRYEDLEKLDRRELVQLGLEDGTTCPALVHVQGKTNLDAAVPLPPLAVRLGERYDWQFPPASDQERNLTIKQVARLAGLSREWDDRVISGNKTYSNWRPVWQVISSHTARHTGGTLVKQVSRNKALAKLLLGHAEEDVTDRYAKDKARHLGPALLLAWRKVLGEFYDKLPNY